MSKDMCTSSMMQKVTSRSSFHYWISTE